ncbi:MAG: hypothetical protein ACREJ3_00715 [Polyangiaceae bacterium]
MLLEVLSALVAGTCVAGSTRRLARAVAPMQIDPRIIVSALEAPSGDDLWDGLPRALEQASGLVAECEFFLAFAIADDRGREARTEELVSEIEGKSCRWGRVPRVCASIASSAGFLFATMALTRALALPASDTRTAVRGVLNEALGALAIGIAGASFCASVHVRAGRVARERMSAVSRLVELALARAHGGARLRKRG